MYSISNKIPYSFWGKGVSLGHSNAVKNIYGVKDALSLTIPQKKQLSLVKKGKTIKRNNLHYRKIYISLESNKLKKEIINKIKNIENYFKNQKTKITCLSQQKLNKIKNYKHKGQIINTFSITDQKFSLSFNVEMQSNPMFTALIILSYVRVFFKLKTKYKYGCFTPLHFSPIDLLNTNTSTTIKTFC